MAAGRRRKSQHGIVARGGPEGQPPAHHDTGLFVPDATEGALDDIAVVRHPNRSLERSDIPEARRAVDDPPDPARGRHPIAVGIPGFTTAPVDRQREGRRESPLADLRQPPQPGDRGQQRHHRQDPGPG